MSLAAKLIASARPAFDAVQCDRIEILSGAAAGEWFTGDLQTEAPIILDGELGGDAREKTLLYVNRPAPALESQDRIQVLAVEWTVTDRDDNEANDRVKFTIVKRVPGKDQ